MTAIPATPTVGFAAILELEKKGLVKTFFLQNGIEPTRDRLAKAAAESTTVN